MYIAAALTCVASFSSFSWGVLRFFTKPSGLSWRAAAVACLGLFFAGWHLHAILTATTAPWRVAVGMVAHTISTAIFWSAIAACRSRPLTAIFEHDPPVHLVQGGPYGYVRHPFYAAYTLFWLGGWTASGSRLALVSVAIMMGVYLLGTREEERKFSRSLLAQEYADYRRRTGRLLPRLGFWNRATGR